MSVSHRCIGRWLIQGAVFAAVASIACAQDATSASHGTSPSGLRGLLHVGSPLPVPELNLSATAGYGLAGKVAPAGGAHPRALGSLAASVAWNRWLALALRFDGRVDFHAGEQGAAYSSAVGDPRLLLRAGSALNDELALGGELGVWLPGRQAPSLDLAATTLDASGLLQFAPRDRPWSLLGLAGLRIDNSAHSAPDVTRLRDGDRIALGLSESNALLLGLGGAYRFAARIESFVELSADVLVGARAPAFGHSPLRAAIGGRYFLSRALQAELTSIVSLSARPAILASDPLVPIEPRFSIIAGVRYGWALPAVGKPPLTGEDEPARRSTLTGRLVDRAGQPVPEADVLLQTSDGMQWRTISDARGGYRFADVPLGRAQLEISAGGFAKTRLEVDVTPSGVERSTALEPVSAASGVIRGLVRSFGSEPLIAQIQVTTARNQVVAKAQSDAAGGFELELAPGRYQIEISAAGYRVQQRSVEVVGGGVAILNVDMRRR